MLITHLDNSIYEHLRLALVASQHLPDIKNSTTPEEFETAKASLNTSSGKITIELYGVGGGENRGSQKINQILIDRGTESEGSRHAGTIEFVPSTETPGPTTTYSKERLPDVSDDVAYSITTIADSMEASDIMREIIVGVFQRRKYLKLVDASGDLTEDTFYITRNSIVDLTNGELIERRTDFTVLDVWLTPREVIRADVPAIIEIRDEIIPVKCEDGKTMQDIVDETPTD